ncbi:hypothetical protein EDD37DRAFT_249536 [Exophiala viscosa]|nr:hypothetical protein EDD37DRAFT_249536 [Exophiala viscosa]
MAEIGVLTNVAQIIGAGLALSKTLYDFAVVLSTAGRDVKDLATDISLFCSVLKQVQSTLTRARAYRLSLSALQAAQDVIDRAQVIFGDLDSTIKNFQKRDSNLDLLARVKWFFTGKRVLLVHEQLKACGTTLQLMLTTLVLAQKVASRR